jgi:amidohydrolase
LLDPELEQEITAQLKVNRSWLRTLRRDLHRHPELRFEEFRTSSRITEELEGMGLEVRGGLAGTGLTATLAGDLPPQGKVHTLALRADLDALPMQEETELSFISEHDGVMHACGHDAHSATIATIARMVTGSPLLRSRLPGNLVFLFQPAEEGGLGAKEMILAGALKNPRVDAMLGFHVHPVLPTGEMAVYCGYSHASADCFDICIQGKGGHAGYPHFSRDPLTPAAELLLAIRTLVSREVDPLSPAVLSVGILRAGHANNVTPETVRIEGTLRCVDEEVRTYLKRRLQELAVGLAASHRATATVNWDQGCPATQNAPGISKVFQEQAQTMAGIETIHWPPPGMGAEDFGMFSQTVPGALFRLGCTSPTATEWWPLHNPRFTLDEDCLDLAAELLLRTAFELLQGGFSSATEGGV